MIRELQLIGDAARREVIATLRDEAAAAVGPWKRYWLGATNAADGRFAEAIDDLTPLLANEDIQLVKLTRTLLLELQEMISAALPSATASSDSYNLYQRAKRTLANGDDTQAEQLFLDALRALSSFEISAAEQILLDCAEFLVERGRVLVLRDILLELGDKYMVKNQVTSWLRRFHIG